MWCRILTILASTTLLILILQATRTTACNEAICASVVSKCLLTQSCKCDRDVTCSCCKECYNCLAYLYDECCSCVDLCPKPNATGDPLSRQSHVADLNNVLSGLFDALTDEPDPQERWTTITYPVDFDLSLFLPNAKDKIYDNYHMQTVDQVLRHPLKPDVMTLNCTVAFMAQCVSWNKCRVSCESMGAASYRWFHNGCCECIGEKCTKYGIGESRCINCPARATDVDVDDAKSFDDYGQDEEQHFNDDDLH